MDVLENSFDTAKEIIMPCRVGSRSRCIDLDVIDAALEALVFRLDVFQVNDVIAMW